MGHLQKNFFRSVTALPSNAVRTALRGPAAIKPTSRYQRHLGPRNDALRRCNKVRCELRWGEAKEERRMGLKEDLERVWNLSREVGDHRLGLRLRDLHDETASAASTGSNSKAEIEETELFKNLLSSCRAVSASEEEAKAAAHAAFPEVQRKTAGLSELRR
jgi:hypothetical protein